METGHVLSCVTTYAVYRDRMSHCCCCCYWCWWWRWWRK